jgi:hypothetical protein
VSLGLKEARARKLIGGWMRVTGDDALGVLAAIQGARERLPAGDVVGYVTRFLDNNSRKPKGAIINGRHPGIEHSVLAVTRELRSRVEGGFDREAG